MSEFEAPEAILRSVAPSERPGQVRALRGAVAVLNRSMQLALRAPTGTGKSFAALIAAAHAPVLSDSGNGRVVVATATNMLQHQYHYEDMPVVEAALRRAGQETPMAMLKGRRHYPCHLLAEQLVADRGQGELALKIEGDDDGTPVIIRRAAEWSMKAERGSDWSGYHGEITKGVLGALTVDGDTCVGRKACKYAGQCHYFAAHDTAREAKIVLVPHALLAVDVAAGGMVIGEYDHVIVDEAHKFEEACIAAFTWELSVTRRPGGDLDGSLPRLGRLLGQIVPVEGGRLAYQLEQAAAQFEQVLRSIVSNRRGDVPLADASGMQLDTLDRLLSDLRVILADADALTVRYTESQGGIDSLPGPVAVSVRRIVSSISKLRGLIKMTAGEVAGTAMFVTGTDRAVALKVANVNVGPMLDDVAWHGADGEPRGVIMMSATIPDGYAERLGLGEVQHLRVDSPFDFEHRAVVYVADDLPEASYRNRATWEPLAGARAAEIADHALHHGGVLVLCSSFEQVKVFRRYIEPVLQNHRDATLVIDGEGPDATPKDQILPELQAASKPVGILSRGYFEGLNLPGKLAAVIMAQVCFPVPSDPLNNAMKELWPHEGWPHPVDASKAACLLEQGLGRLHRSPADRGVLAILDRRAYWGPSGVLLREVFPKGAPVALHQHGAWVLQWLAGGQAVAA